MSVSPNCPIAVFAFLATPLIYLTSKSGVG